MLCRKCVVIFKKCAVLFDKCMVIFKECALIFKKNIVNLKGRRSKHIRSCRILQKSMWLSLLHIFCVLDHTLDPHHTSSNGIDFIGIFVKWALKIERTCFFKKRNRNLITSLQRECTSDCNKSDLGYKVGKKWTPSCLITERRVFEKRRSFGYIMPLTSGEGEGKTSLTKINISMKFLRFALISGKTSFWGYMP